MLPSENWHCTHLSAFEAYYNAYNRLMFYAANRILNDVYLSEDAVAESFVKIYRNFDKLITPISPEGKRFAVIVTENTAIDMLRRANREPTDYSSTEEAAYTPDLDSELSFLELLRMLPDEYRLVFELKYGCNYTCKEVAEVVGFSVAKIEQILCRGRKLLRKKYKETLE